MQITLKKFSELSVNDLYALLQLRNNVFVVEQNCPYPDTDDKDQKAMHLLIWEGSELTAYARILSPGVSYPEASIGRVVTSGNHRGKGLGKILMERCIQETQNLYPQQEIVISAQAHLDKFYSDLGFKAEGEVYPEDDIPHQKMRLAVNHNQNSSVI